MERFNGTKKGTFIYVDHDSYSFSTYKTVSKTVYLKCRTKGCPVRASFVQENDEMTQVKQNKIHNHVQDADIVEKIKLRNFLLQKSETTNNSFALIFEEGVRMYPKAAKETGNLDYYKSCMQRARSRAIPFTPKNLEQMRDVLESDTGLKYREDLDYPPHKFFDGLYFAGDGSKILIFVSHRVIETVKRKDAFIIQSDATYKILPHTDDMYQIFTVSYQYQRRVYPILYAIMERKTEEAYIKVFNVLKEQLNGSKIEVSMSDYEAAVINAVQKVFPEVEAKGCFFHYSKAVVKKARKLGLFNAADDTNTIRCAIKYAASLALLPRKFIVDGMALVEDKLNDTLESRKFMRYMRRQWLKKDISVYKDKVRTNNACESMHRRFITVVGKPHPTVFNFIRFIQEFENHAAIELSRDINSISLPKNRRKQYIQDDERIMKAEKTLEMTNDVELFLRLVCDKTEGRMN